MRHGYVGNTELQKRLDRADPSVHLFVEAVVTDAEDAKVTSTQWAAADSIVGLEILAQGGVKLAGSPETLLSQTTNDDDLTDIGGPNTTPMDVAVVEWTGANAECFEMDVVTLRLDPAFGGAKNVATWKAQLFRLAGVDLTDGGSAVAWSLEPLGSPATATPGSSVGNIAFNFAADGFGRIVGPAPANSRRLDGDDDAGSRMNRPTTIVMVWGFKSDGTTATNVSWRADSNSSTDTISGHVFSHYTLEHIADQGHAESGTLFKNGGTSVGLPYCVIAGNTYTETPVEFTSGNLLDLDAAPTNPVEVFVEFASPSGTSVTNEMSDDGGSTWVVVKDGDEIRDDDNLYRLTAGRVWTAVDTITHQQTYSLRSTLTPSANDQATPVVYRFGVREATRKNLDGLAKVSNVRWGVDPVTLKAEIPEVEITLLRDGVRDYRDTASEILSGYYIGDVLYRLWVGDEDLDRQYWLHIDDFVEDDRDSAGAGVVLTCVAALAKTRRSLPPTTSSTFQPIVYEGATSTAKNVWNDLISQMGLPARLIGQGLTATGQTYSRTIKEEKPGKHYLDQLAFLEGMAVIPSQGRIKVADFYSGGPTVATFPSEEMRMASVTPGFRARITDQYVPYGWTDAADQGKGAWGGKTYSTASNAVANLDRALIDINDRLDNDTAKWIEDASTASGIATRTTERFGSGLILWTFDTIHAKPWLEPGDMVSVETDKFVARDPNLAQAIRGMVWATGRILACHNAFGTRFTVWVTDYADIVASNSAVTVVNYMRPEAYRPVVTINAAGVPELAVTCNADSGSIKYLSSTTGYPTKASVSTGGTVVALTSEHLKTGIALPTAAYGVTTYVTVLAYETATGAGAESADPAKVQVMRGLGEASKTHRIAFCGRIGDTEPANPWKHGGAAVFPHNTDYHSGSMNLDVVPPGVALTALKVHTYRAATGDDLSYQLNAYTSGGVTATGLIVQIATGIATGWSTTTHSLSHTATDAYTYAVFVAANTATHATNVRFSYVDIVYTSADVHQTL